MLKFYLIQFLGEKYVGCYREQIVKVAKLMYEKGMVNAFAGNLSVRDGNNVYITPSGICKGFLKEDMIVKTDMNGNILEGMYKPSSE